jgi:hypothetical protein
MSLTVKQQQEQDARTAIRKAVRAALAELDRPGGDPLAYLERIRDESIEKLESELARRAATSSASHQEKPPGEAAERVKLE